jgi:hypothetical protein
MRCDIALYAGFAQPDYGITCSAELEGARTLKILTFAVETAAQLLVEPGIAQHGCQAGPVIDSGPRQVDIGNIRNIDYSIWGHFRLLFTCVRPIILGLTALSKGMHLLCLQGNDK